MNFLDVMTASDWAVIFVLDAAVFLLGFLAGEEAVKDQEKPDVK